MDKIVLDVQIGELKDNMIIHYNKEKGLWETISYVDFNAKLYNENAKLKKEIAELESELTNFKKAVNEKLESYHKILSILTKE